MKRCIIIGLLFMMPLAVRGQHRYIMVADVWAACGSVNASFAGRSWSFPGQWGGTTFYSYEITVSNPLSAGMSIFLQPNLTGGCCESPTEDCVDPASASIYYGGGDPDNLLAAYGTGLWQFSASFIKLPSPVISEQRCDAVTFRGISDTSGSLSEIWQISATGTDPWYPLGSNYVTPEIVSWGAMDPYGQLFARYITRGLNTLEPGGFYDFSPSEIIPFRLYHAAPALTPLPTDQLCATVSGVTIANATLLLPQVKVGIRKKNQGEWEPLGVDTIYSSSSFAGRFFSYAPGNYEMAVRNWDGTGTDACHRIFTFEVKGRYPPLVVTAMPTHETCYDVTAATGSIAVSVGGAEATAPYTYDWSHGPKTRDVDHLAGDRTYSVTVRDAKGCVGTGSATVEEPEPIATTRAYLFTDVSCHANTTGVHNNGVIRIEASGGTQPLAYRVQGASHSTAYPTVPGVVNPPYVDIGNLNIDTYTVYVRDANGCEKTFAQPVALGPNDITYSSIDQVNIICHGAQSGSITIYGATGGTGGLQYALNGGTYQSTNSFANLFADNYTVSIRDSKNCRKDLPVTLTQSTAITFDPVTALPESCSGVEDGSLTVSASGGAAGITYALEDRPSAYRASGTFTGLAAAHYSVYAKDAAGCVVPVSATVNKKAGIAATVATGRVISCYGRSDGALDLTVTGGGTAPFTYQWSHQGATTEDITNLRAGVYSVTITDSKTCDSTLTYTLTEPAVLALHAETSDYSTFGVRCIGGSDGTIDLDVTGGTTPYQYTWTSGRPATEDQENLSPGAYGVAVRDNRGCEASLSNIEIIEPTALVLGTPREKHIRCHAFSDGEIEGFASGGAGAYQYALNGGAWQDGALFTGLVAGTYTVQLRDGNACLSDIKSVTLDEPTALVLTPLPKQETTCGHANGALAVRMSGGAGDYRYAWHRADDPVAVIGTTASVAGLRSGNYTLAVEDGHACLVEEAFFINDSDGPQITQTLLQGLTCHDSNDGAIGVSVAGGLAPYAITWDIPAATGTAVDHVTGGAHWIEVFDDRGCFGRETFSVSFPPALELRKTLTPPLCMGRSDGQIAVQVSGGNEGGYDYLWNTGETAAVLDHIKAGRYSVVVTDSKRCTLSESFTLTEPALYTVDAGGDRTICVGQKLTVRAPDDAVTYLWTSDAGYASTTREVVLTTSARYTLKVANANGCEATDRFTLGTSNDLLAADFLMAHEAHAGDTVVLVDISWPQPDHIGWTFPEGVQLLIEEDAYAMVVFPEAGAYEVVLDTHLGECVDYLARSITIEGERSSENGRVGASMVSRFEVYPNPNDGVFKIAIDLREPADGNLTMVDLSGGKTFLAETLTDRAAYSFQTAFERIPSGVYFLILRVEGKIYHKRVVIR